MSWAKMNVFSIDLIRLNIYQAKVNAVIPWACIQTLTWVSGDPNPGTAIRVSEDGTYEVLAGYYFYKQVAPIGQPGMKVAAVKTPDKSDIGLIAFAGNATKNPDAFAVLNKSEDAVKVKVNVKGSGSNSFDAYRTTRKLEDKNKRIGRHELRDAAIDITVPGRSVVTFTGR